MKSTGPLKHFVLAFGIAVVIYALAYTGIENRRTHNGPWDLVFAIDPSGAPSITINQPKLNIANVRLSFPNQPTAATNAHVLFAVPRQVPFEVPFGTCLFIDTTFQPGTLAFNFFGHEVQLMPRALTLDRQEYPWKSETLFAITNRPILSASNYLPARPKP